MKIYNWECTALSLLTNGGTDVDEVSHAGWRSWSFEKPELAKGLKLEVIKMITYEERS